MLELAGLRPRDFRTSCVARLWKGIAVYATGTNPLPDGCSSVTRRTKTTAWPCRRAERKSHRVPLAHPNRSVLQSSGDPSNPLARALFALSRNLRRILRSRHRWRIQAIDFHIVGPGKLPTGEISR